MLNARLRPISAANPVTASQTVGGSGTIVMTCLLSAMIAVAGSTGVLLVNPASASKTILSDKLKANPKCAKSCAVYDWRS